MLLNNKEELDKLLKNREHPEVFSTGEYSFLMILEMPDVLKDADKNTVQHCIEYGFIGLNWHNICKTHIEYRQEFFLKFSSPILPDISNLISQTPIDNEDSDKLNKGKAFQFLYIITDNVFCNVLQAYYIPDSYITNINIVAPYTYRLNYQGIPLIGKDIDNEAKKQLKWINENTIFKEENFK
jgi:hypothetical protein